MNFTSIAFYFLFFFTVTALVITQHFCHTYLIRIQTILLLFMSILFSGWQNWKFAAILLTEGLFVYMLGENLERTGKKCYLTAGVCLCLAALGIFKYYNFLGDTVNFFGIPLKRINLLLPIGISFYTFSAISYLVDIYKGRFHAKKDLPAFLLYLSFFPKLTAGPIMSCENFFSQLNDSNRRITLHSISHGLQIICFGLVKKNVFADQISVFVNAVYDNVAMYNAPTLLLAICAYGIQIYFDFSGYSDLAIGIGECLGFHLPCNFNMPYLSRNVTEFWKRWHITLSDWLMTYVYIPLGGNRSGYVRTLLNLLITMTLGGLWHGASWNFVIWGILHGAALCIHKQFTRAKHLPKTYRPSPFYFLINVCATCVFVDFCWIFFRITELSVIMRLFCGIITLQHGVAFYSFWAVSGILAFITAACVCTWKNYKQDKRSGRSFSYHTIKGFYMIHSLSTFSGLLVFFLTVGCILGLAYAHSNPFIYAAF